MNAALMKHIVYVQIYMINISLDKIKSKDNKTKLKKILLLKLKKENYWVKGLVNILLLLTILISH